MSDMKVTRRGFLSLCASVPFIAKVPHEAEPLYVPPAPEIEVAAPAIDKIAANSMYGKMIRVMRYSMTLMSDEIMPGRVGLLRATPSQLFRPDRILMNETGFSLLHLNLKGEPILEDEIPSEYFLPAAYGSRLDFATIGPDTEVVVAVVNRNPVPKRLFVSFTGAAHDENPMSDEQLLAQLEDTFEGDEEYLEEEDE